MNHTLHHQRFTLRYLIVAETSNWLLATLM